MAKTFEELEEEEMLERKEKLAGMQTLKDFRKEEERQKKANLRLSKVYDEQVYKPFLAGRTPQQVVAEKQASQKAQRTADVAKAREDMRSGKTSSLVGKAGQEGDPYAGKGKSPITFKSQAEADRSGLTRYNLDEPKGFAESQQRQGPVEVRKATGSKQVFKAMVQGDPTQDQVFDTKKEAEAYIARKDAEAKQKARMEIANKLSMQGKSGKEIEAYLKENIGSFGVKGAVAGVRMTGGSGEEIKAKESKYREQAGSAAKKEKELKALYDKRMAAAQERIEKVQKGEITPEQAAGARMEERIAETDPDRAAKFKTARESKIEGRQKRKAEIENQRRKNIFEGKASGKDFFADVAAKRAAPESEAIYNRQIRDIRNAAKQAREAKDYAAAFNLEKQADMFSANVPKESGARRRYFERINVGNYRIQRERSGQPVESRANPFL
jgi:hypothetical protein